MPGHRSMYQAGPSTDRNLITAGLTRLMFYVLQHFRSDSHGVKGGIRGTPAAIARLLGLLQDLFLKFIQFRRVLI